MKADDDEWSVPVGVGINKTTFLGKTPVKLGFEVQKYIVQRDGFDSDWFVRLKFAPVIEVLRS